LPRAGRLQGASGGTYEKCAEKSRALKDGPQGEKVTSRAGLRRLMKEDVSVPTLKLATFKKEKVKFEGCN